MIENVEELGSKLGVKPFLELPILEDGEIPVSEAGVAKHVAAHIAEASISGWGQHRIPLHVTSEVHQGRDGEGAICLSGTHTGCRRRRYLRRYAINRLGDRGKSSAVCSGTETGNRVRARREVRRISLEIPGGLGAVIQCVGS